MSAIGNPRTARAPSIALACALACVVLLPLLGHRPLAEWDEGIYAEVAREMLRAQGWAGGWLTPHWNFQPWMEKPPLEMWLTAALYRLFGVSEFTARAVSAFAGVATVGVLHAWMLRRLGRLSAWLGTICLLASFGFQHAARAGETDVLLSLWLLVALMGIARLASDERHGWLLFWVGFGMALMTKGAACLVTLPALAAVLAMDGRALRAAFARRSLAECGCGLLLFAAIALPWHWWMWRHFGAGFTHTYLGWQVLDRAAHPIEGHMTHWWYYLWVLLVSAPLVSLAYPLALAGPWRSERLRVLRPFTVFAVLEVVLFSVARTRLPHYLCPAYAPLSGLAGAWAAEAWRRPVESGRPARARLVWVPAAAVVLFVAVAGSTARARRGLHSPKLADGSVAPDNRESSMLLRRVFGRDPGREDSRLSLGTGPLLLWRAGRFVPINTALFYARRPVQQVALESVTPETAVDRYTNDPETLEAAVADGPHWLLVETPLLGELPGDLVFEPIQSGIGMKIGVVKRR